MPNRIERIMRKQGLTRTEAANLAKGIDEARENYIREMTVAVISNKDFDEASFRATTDKFQEKWVTSHDEVICGSADQDLLTYSRLLREKYRTQLDQFTINH